VRPVLLPFYLAVFLWAAPWALEASLPLGATVNQSGTTVTGVTFRVWAPNATGVAVRGDFNGWGETALTKDNTTGYWSVTVAAARPGQEYKYYVRWTGNSAGAWRNDPRAVWVRNDNSVIYDHAAFDWGAHARPVIPVDRQVMYELHVGTFHDPDPDDGRPGTFDDAITRLDYLARLGVNVIALMPVNEFGSETSWGYNPDHPFAIEASYGGPDGLKRFVKAAHALGMKVQLDVVHNHWDPPAEGVRDFDGPANIYFYPDGPSGWTAWGPRPNYAEPEVRRFIKENIKTLLDDFRVDGFRWDSPQNFLGYDATAPDDGKVGNPQTVLPEGQSLLMEINRLIHEQYPGRWSIAEDADLLTVRPAGSWYQPGGFLDLLRVDDAADSFDGHWQTSFHDAITREIASTSPSASAVNNKINEWSEPPGYRVIFTDNHDKAGDLNVGLDPATTPLKGWRLANRMDPVNQVPGTDAVELVRTNSMDDPVVRRRVLLNAVLTLTAPGVPMLFMGQEFGATGAFTDGRRMDWREASRQSATFRAHRDLVALRAHLPALRTLGLGANGNSWVNGSVLAYPRTNGVAPADHVYVALNFSPNSAGVALTNLPSGGDWYARVNTDWTIYGGATPPSTNALTTNMVLPLPPYSAVVLAKAPPDPAQLTDANPDVPDGWLSLFGLADPAADDDLDGLSNLFEYQNGLDPLEKDTATVTYNGVTHVLRASSNNPVVQHIAWAVDPVSVIRSSSFAFLGGSIPGPFFTNPAGTYLRFTFNLTDGTTGYSVFSPDTNLAVVDTNRTNWAVFHGVTDFNANPDGDTFSNLQEFARGSDPNAWNRALICLAGEFNGWNASANPLAFAGGNVWVLDLPKRGGSSGLYKFTIGDWAENWGDNAPADGIGDPGGADDITKVFGQGNGIYRFRFNEETLAYQITYDPTDADGDGIQDAWIAYHGLTGHNASADADPDADGISNLDEFRRLSHPLVADRMSVVGSRLPLSWDPDAPALRMTWSGARQRWEWTGTFTSGTLDFKFASGPGWGGSNYGTGATIPAGVATTGGNNDLSATLVAGRYRFAFNEFTGGYSIASYPVSTEWWETNGLPGTPAGASDWNEDSDGDGFTHRLEYALGGNPLVANGSGLFSTRTTNAGGTNRLVLQWLQRTNDSALSVVPLLSTNLSSTNWSALTASNSANTSGVPADHRRREVSVPVDGAAKFLRLRVTGP
jgi:1,4-alpha-glucan branching enzyme